jgi:hypothetical protein
LLNPHLKHFYMQQLLETLIHPVARQVRTASVALISEKLKRSVMAVQEPRDEQGSREGDSSQQQVPPETAMAQEALEPGAGEASQNEGSGAPTPTSASQVCSHTENLFRRASCGSRRALQLLLLRGALPRSAKQASLASPLESAALFPQHGFE